MIKLYKLQFFPGCDAGELVGKMVDKFKINQQKFSNFLGTLGYHDNLISFPNMTCEMSIESSQCPLKKLEKKIKERIKITSTGAAQALNNQFLNNQFLVTRNCKG